jgi:hypothetical protein
MAVSIKITDFWHVMPCYLAQSYPCFRGSHRLHLQGRRVGLTQKLRVPIQGTKETGLLLKK